MLKYLLLNAVMRKMLNSPEFDAVIMNAIILIAVITNHALLKGITLSVEAS